MDLTKLDEAIDKILAYGPSKKDAMKDGAKKPSKPPSDGPESMQDVTKHDR